MPESKASLKDELMQGNEEFRSLFEEHRRNEERLEELYQKSLLSEEDELEEKQIKRHKLFLKDRMEAILRSHESAAANA